MGIDFSVLTLKTLRTQLCQRQISCSAFMEHLLRHIARLEPQIQAWEWLDPERARQQAQDCDQQLVTGSPPPLCGIPIGIKDIIATAGIPTRMGSPIYANHVPSYSATVVETVQAAGAILLGKTVTTEFAYRHPGNTRNPWNLSHTPGGSSSGSAAAVASGMVPLALGSQTMGSVIRPAAFCGIVGYKPSYGAISRFGMHPFSPTLDHVGVFGRRVWDVWQLAAVLAGRDERDPATTGQTLSAPATGSGIPRLGMFKTPWWHQAEPSQRAHFQDWVEMLQTAGAVVTPWKGDPALGQGPQIVATLMAYEAAQIYLPLAEQYPGQLSQSLQDLIAKGSRISRWDYESARRQRQHLQQRWQESTAGLDGILTLPALGPAPQGLAFTGDALFCKTWTLLGIPAITLPTGQTEAGLPLGTQLLGRLGEDESLLRAALACEAIGIPAWQFGPKEVNE
ncbi:MAG: amidase [Thermostichus sp. BF3_bins_97]